MTVIFTAEQLTAMRTAQTSHMNDVINITTRTPYYDSYGDVLYSGVVQSGVACGFNFTEGVEIDRGQVVVVDYDAEVRLPLSTQIDINDTVELVSLAGTTISGHMFEVFEYPEYSTTVKHVHLKKRIPDVR